MLKVWKGSLLMVLKLENGYFFYFLTTLLKYSKSLISDLLKIDQKYVNNKTLEHGNSFLQGGCL